MNNSHINEGLDSCCIESAVSHSVSNSSENEVDGLNHVVQNETDEELKGDEIMEVNKGSDDSETNDDIDSSSSNCCTINAHSNCDHFSETSSQELPDSGTEMESDTRAVVKDYTVPNLSAEDELLVEINRQLPESEDVSKSRHPNGMTYLNHPAYKTLTQELARFKEQVSVLHSEISR
jgi:hypothetical protein